MGQHNAIRLVRRRHKASRDKEQQGGQGVDGQGRVTVNDLYNLALANLKEWQSKDGCHFTRQGYEELAKQVAPTISDALSKKARAAKSATVDGRDYRTRSQQGSEGDW